jgi:hypothetical protein
MVTGIPHMCDETPKPKKAVALSGIAAADTAISTVGRTAATICARTDERK